MVKPLDDRKSSPPPGAPPADHIGWLLWNATERWLERFVEEMRSAGHSWFGPAQARVMGYLDRRGTRQGALTERTGLSKQAIQQTLDDLEAKGIVRRDSDPDDRRGRIIRYTPAGVAVLADVERIKRKLDRRATARLSVAEAARLRAQLVDLAQRLSE